MFSPKFRPVSGLSPQAIFADYLRAISPTPSAGFCATLTNREFRGWQGTKLVLFSKRTKQTTTRKELNNMPSKEEIAVVRKATVYDLQKILDKGDKDKTYTVEEIKDLMDAYVTGADQT